MLCLNVRIKLRDYCGLGDKFVNVYFYPSTTRYYVSGPSAELASQVARWLPTPGLIHVSSPLDSEEEPTICEEFQSIPKGTKIIGRDSVSFPRYADEHAIKTLLAKALAELERIDSGPQPAEVPLYRTKVHSPRVVTDLDGTRHFLPVSLELVPNDLAIHYAKIMKHKQDEALQSGTR